MHAGPKLAALSTVLLPSASPTPFDMLRATSKKGDALTRRCNVKLCTGPAEIYCYNKILVNLLLQRLVALKSVSGPYL